MSISIVCKASKCMWLKSCLPKISCNIRHIGNHRRSQDVFSGGTLFENFNNNSIRKWRKFIILAHFQKSKQSMHKSFERLDEKHNLLEILRKITKVFKNFLKKIAKNALSLHIFQNILQTMR